MEPETTSKMCCSSECINLIALFHCIRRQKCGELISGCERQSGECVFQIRTGIDAKLLARHGEVGEDLVVGHRGQSRRRATS